jgi:hypothetical protein
MKPWVFLIVAIVILGLLLVNRKERFQPEFLDKRQVAQTVATEDSSYLQRTNHMIPTPFNTGPIAGMETPFQVNQYRSYVN